MASNGKQTPRDVRSFLAHQKRKTVTLDAMQAAFPRMSYDAFRFDIRTLEQEHVLVPIKASGTDAGGLARKYSIHLGPLYAETAKRIEQEAMDAQISGALDLSWYFEQAASEWQQDKCAIAALSRYLKAHPCPANELTKTSLQQRSYDIFGDEKFLLAHGDLLKRLNLSRDALAIAPEADPLMMAFHPSASAGSLVHHHLIVENKAPWMALAPHLAETNFTSLVLGYGWKICASIGTLPLQSGDPDGEHIVWYFGDFDWEGLRIWHTLAGQVNGPPDERSTDVASSVETTAAPKIRIKLAVPFYTAFLSHPASLGKEQQTPAPEALDAFLSCVHEAERARFRDLLTTGHYYPQEALTTSELLSCCKEMLANGT